MACDSILILSKLPIVELFIFVGNLMPKLKSFFKPKLKPIFFLLNCLPEPRARVGLGRLEYAERVVGEVVREHESPLGVVRPRGDDLRLESQDLYV